MMAVFWTEESRVEAMAAPGRRGPRKRSNPVVTPTGSSHDREGTSSDKSQHVPPPFAAGGTPIADTSEVRGTPMADTTPPWLATMRSIDGTHWAPGDGPNSTILDWLRFISSAYPNMAEYCASVMHDDYFSWCGLTVGYCMTKAGVAPVFGSSDTSRFLWAAAWLGWGTPVATPQSGDVLVFDFGGGDHHVTLFESDNGNGTWSCRGGNQAHRAMVTNFPKSKLMGIRRANAASAVVQPTPTPVAANLPSKDFTDCVALVLQYEGGNDDDPRDPGGRTSRGILQREWDVWRQTHPGLPSDVWQAPQDHIIAIYDEKYWEPLCCDSLPAGVDLAVFDYGVNSGIGRSAKVLQGFVGTDVDGEIGPKTIAATAQVNASSLINRICDERLTFLQGLGTWQTFGRGWTNRVQGVRHTALGLVGAAAPVPPAPAPIPPTPAPVPPAPVPIPPAPAPVPPAPAPIPPAPAPIPPFRLPTPADLFDQLRQLIERLEANMASATTIPQQLVGATPTTSTPSQANLAALIQQALAIIQTLNAAPSQPTGTTPAQPQDQVKQVINVLNALLGAAADQPADGSKPPLGQVNGALGQTIGNLLNGNKSAIGIIGSLATSILQSAGPNVPLSTILPSVTSSAGLGSVAMPFFLAMAAWGVLGKLEKWSPQASPPPSK
jgi:uncharacterized protein (TIGR02594 family)